jgi:hypothetical protein
MVSYEAGEDRKGPPVFLGTLVENNNSSFSEIVRPGHIAVYLELDGKIVSSIADIVAWGRIAHMDGIIGDSASAEFEEVAKPSLSGLDEIKIRQIVQETKVYVLLLVLVGFA